LHIPHQTARESRGSGQQKPITDSLTGSTRHRHPHETFRITQGLKILQINVFIILK
jgi:hypothetical protein